VKLSAREITKFRKAIYEYYNEHGRDLPWRGTRDPYYILVSEIMLQQTQVERVVEKYTAFVQRFPDFRVLAETSFQDVLSVWQGLGYNRRAAALKRIGEIVTEKHNGELPADLGSLAALPGIGYNTACAILTYAFNEPVAFIETNVRTVFIHFFFRDRERIKDSEILPLVEQTLDRKKPHAWYSALMDYGTMLKKTHGSINPKSAHYQKQSPYKGSDRQIRGMVLKHLLQNSHSSRSDMTEIFGVEPDRLQRALRSLEKEGFVRESRGVYSIAS